jgi:hypothetical protein
MCPADCCSASTSPYRLSVLDIVATFEISGVFAALWSGRWESNPRPKFGKRLARPSPPSKTGNDTALAVSRRTPAAEQRTQPTSLLPRGVSLSRFCAGGYVDANRERLLERKYNSAAHCNDSVKRRPIRMESASLFVWSRLWTNFGPKPLLFVAMNQH